MPGRHVKTQGGLNTLLTQWFPAPPHDKKPWFVVVADIGQGNCNVVFDVAGKPLVYFDFGGGFGKSRHTYPDPDLKFCYLASTRFILSHWDLDHYQTMNLLLANKETFHNAPWLAPDQASYDVDNDSTATIEWKSKIMRGVEADGLLEDLAKVADVHLWPDERPDNVTVLRASGEHFRVIKVTGTNRNNHALALRVSNPNVANEYILLTGDAEYQEGTFDHQADQRCVGLVASHHGSPVDHPADIPRPKPNVDVLIAYSFGWGNEYGHPHQARGVPAYEGRGWHDESRMDTGGAEVAAKYAGPRGNVGLTWSAGPLGPGVVAAPGGALEINQAAVALIATAVAEIDTYQAAVAQRGAIAVAAAYQAAREAGALTVASAMKTPAALLPPKTLLEVAGDQGTVHASLQLALGDAPGDGGAADQAMSLARQSLAHAVVDAVMIASARVDQVVRQVTSAAVDTWVEEFKAKDTKGREPTLPDQAKYALSNAADCAGSSDTEEDAKAAIPDSFAQRIHDAARACQNAHLPASLDDIKADIALAVTRAALEMIGNRKSRQSQPPAVSEEAVNEMTTLRADLKAAIGAASGLAPFIPLDPKASAPSQLIHNENAKIVARVAALAAAVGVVRGAAPEVAARAGAAAARVALAAAHGLPQVACHRHPRACDNAKGPCTLSIHSGIGMFKPRAKVQAPGFGDPRGLAYDNQWNLYVADAGRHCVYKVDAAGNRTVFAGVENTAGNGAGGQLATATQLRAPRDVFFHPERESLFIADSGNHRIREVELATGNATLVAGSGTAGFQPGTAAVNGRLNTPSGLALDLDNNVLIADTGNNRVRLLDLEHGLLRSVAGDGNTSVLNGPMGVAVDDVTGHIYVADTGNHRIVRLAKGTHARTVVAGLDTAAANTGDGLKATDARLNRPQAVRADVGGLLYIADTGNHRIRRINLNANPPTMHAVAGKANGTTGNSPDGAALAAVELNAPRGLYVDAASRNAFVSDAVNTRVLRLLL
ncbi:hypothetical protein [Myxococcus sp. SDU36]|uniref:NHL domain-containing protein n=1 Tax=Myxococcus sp. SDU36 TaxID=2831967 RepID=UPI002543EE42|nr:hypothetical protein [Myxococcus sp. SDU36]WIG98647.1 hypothetical protein KGD87_15350 [Myxococcus sp. SDU36]